MLTHLLACHDISLWRHEGLSDDIRRSPVHAEAEGGEGTKEIILALREKSSLMGMGS